MSPRSKAALGGAATGALILLAAWWFRAPDSPHREAPRPAPPAAAAAPGQAAPPRAAAAPASPRAAPIIPWGASPGALGKSSGSESNPEAPMSLALTARGDALVLDQVNHRIARFDPSGAPLTSWPLEVRAPRDLAVGPGGSVAVLGQGEATLLGPDGRVRSTQPLGALPDPAAASGLSLDERGLWVEQGHAWEYLLGSSEKRDGRLSRDGALLLSAGLAEAQAGTAWVRALDAKTGQLRWQRRYAFAAPVLRLALLDSFERGGLAFAAHVAREITPGHFADEAMQLLCLAPDGAVLNTFTLPPPEGPEEAQRELAAGLDGTILYLHRTASGAELLRLRCPD